ncbi:MAG: cell division protein FtsX [Patescibacteria group bacterium]
MITFFRSIKWAFKSFFRHFTLSLITIIIITFSLFSLNLLLFLNIIGKIIINNLQSRIDITVYLRNDLTQKEIDEFRDHLTTWPEIKQIVYLSPEESLARFKEKHKKDELILKSLEILGENPLGGIFILKANSLESYHLILRKIAEPTYDKFIQEKEYYEHEKIITLIKNISQKISLAGLSIVAIFTFISIIAIFNSIQLAIYTREDEIKIMRLIGATSSFTRLPFVIENILYGICAWFFNLLIFFAIFKFALPKIINFLEIESQVFFSYQKEIIYSFIGVLFFSIFLTVISSWLAVRKYIKT